MTDWYLGIDYGPGETLAAAAQGATARLIQLGRTVGLPSLVYLAGDGSLVAGDEAAELAKEAPERSMAMVATLLGSREPLFPGLSPAIAEDAAAATLRLVLDAARQQQGGAPAGVRLSHPARWRATRRQALSAAARAAGISQPVLVPATIALAYRLASSLRPGELAAVYWMGALSCVAVVLQRTGTGWREIGPPSSMDVGGEDLDQLLIKHLVSQLDDNERSLLTGDAPGNREAARSFARSARRAREELSARPTAVVDAPGGRFVRVTRDELEEILEPVLAITVDQLAASLKVAASRPEDLSAVLLGGGASKVPLIERLVSQAVGRAPLASDERRADVALGAAAMLADSEPLPVLRPLTPPARPEAALQPAIARAPDLPPAQDQSRPLAPVLRPITPLAGGDTPAGDDRPPGRDRPPGAGSAKVIPRESARHAWRRSGLMVAAAGVVVLLLFVLAFPEGLTGLLGGGSANPSGSPGAGGATPGDESPRITPTIAPTDSPTPDLHAQLAAMLPETATECVPGSLEEGDAVALDCRAEQLDLLSYRLKVDQSALAATITMLRDNMSVDGIVSDEEVCPQGEWHYDDEPGRRGDLICFIGTDGTAIIVSTLDERLLFQRLERNDGDLPALYSSWTGLVPLRPEE